MGRKAYAYPCGSKTNDGVRPFWYGRSDPCGEKDYGCQTVHKYSAKTNQLVINNAHRDYVMQKVVAIRGEPFNI